jgi:hypothetical protein
MIKKSDIKWETVKTIEEKQQKVEINLTCQQILETVKKDIKVQYKILQCEEKCYMKVLVKPFYFESSLTKIKPNFKDITRLLESKLLSKYKDIALRHKKNKQLYFTLNIEQGDKVALNKLYHHSKQEQFQNKYIGNIWNDKEDEIKYKISNLTNDDFKDFLSLEKFIDIITKDRCGYCGISIDDILKLSESKLYTKRARGYVMEVDQIDASGGYTTENCIACCYWCNNAKTDEFSVEDFKEIARGINVVWKSRGADIIEFNEDEYKKRFNIHK